MLLSFNFVAADCCPEPLWSFEVLKAVSRVSFLKYLLSQFDKSYGGGSINKICSPFQLALVVVDLGGFGMKLSNALVLI
ncbi:hypothetical protein T07_1854 [Trichinella nelsoni]|uniref:Uncharacterized protein n=1 Tax=Trichinella nelsoni TaxID=6336 RepID=A0A0V0S2X5_9BILA|nr:hypothetical protein T07_1854 [Trichinella nelsoni]